MMLPVYALNNSTYTDFFTNPVNAILSPYVQMFGNWFYGILIFVIGIDLYIKTKNIASVSIYFIIFLSLFGILFTSIPVLMWLVTIIAGLGVAYAFYKLAVGRSYGG